ncbi:hypothetical protein HD842_000930 [Massilia aurea]|uniref:Uncharacterized protein n=1 Tax=Massilia aurea TaxID=373040 RepID=A0A7W9WXU2_9BURK|nr:hypothetical protein [Massilia aurea]MBB6132819.1 hypothetical protein [Massilia aurea]
MSIGWFLISGSFDPNIVILRYSKKVCWRRPDFRFRAGCGLALRLLAIALIISGIVMLKLLSPA